MRARWPTCGRETRYRRWRQSAGRSRRRWCWARARKNRTRIGGDWPAWPPCLAWWPNGGGSTDERLARTLARLVFAPGLFGLAGGAAAVLLAGDRCETWAGRAARSVATGAVAALPSGRAGGAGALRAAPAGAGQERLHGLRGRPLQQRLSRHPRGGQELGTPGAGQARPRRPFRDRYVWAYRQG